MRNLSELVGGLFRKTPVGPPVSKTPTSVGASSIPEQTTEFPSPTHITEPVAPTGPALPTGPRLEPTSTQTVEAAPPPDPEITFPSSAPEVTTTPATNPQTAEGEKAA